ncbi:GNAT family N-acetyltransferase [Croceiramulus getboli]|nr:GNAT family N-acetyltransferase [Flavobacteriaceae bacterium YJPT1-3]
MSRADLQNSRAELIPLQLEHFDQLLPVSQEVDLYRYGPSDVSSPQKLKSYIQNALDDRAQGVALPYLIFDKRLEAVAGSTRFGYIDQVNQTVHIGWTWLGDRFRGSGLNAAIKALMLDYAYESLGMHKVCFRIDERNTRSRKAVEKLGATLEGVLREELIVKGGYRRSTACYGLLQHEWLNHKKKNRIDE